MRKAGIALGLALALASGPALAQKSASEKTLDAIARCIDRANRTIKDGAKLRQAVALCQSQAKAPARSGYATKVPDRDTLIILRNDGN